ncbi:AzlC family ABC transporter permease [uncultured Nitratireductor sp.]|uniref:AzlC family ABC transporter permease n=1 Tax=uncultured Nitratireductor sp. TaxID=520953 RepID=UPI0025E8AD2C|nr:AzlC family ABC transporter permease [uncultured Nitratireductor sp.]
MTADIAKENAHPRDLAQGLRDSVPVVVAAMPFGFLFGALAVENGLTAFEAVLMSATIFAGASQMVGIDLFGQKVAPWLIVLSILAVNFRHVLYSATTGRRIAHWGPVQRLLGFFLLVDPMFAEAERRGETHGTVTFGWYMGAALPLYVCWVVEAWLGALFGNLLPDPHALGIDFLLPIYFLGLVMSFRKRSFWLPVVLMSAVVSMIAYRTVGSPWHVSIGAVAGVALAATMAPGARTRKEES